MHSTLPFGEQESWFGFHWNFYVGKTSARSVGWDFFLSHNYALNKEVREIVALILVYRMGVS